MKNRWLVFASLLVVFTLVAAACGDDDAATTTTTRATTTTVAATTVATTTLPPAPEVAFDIGVTPDPCPEATNEGNGCIYLGIITDLSGPFKLVAGPLSEAQQDFWGAVNAAGGIDGWDVVVGGEYTRDAGYDPAATVAAATELSERVLGLAQSLGTPHTQAALDAVYDDEDIVAAPATWWSGWAFDEVDSGLVMEAGSNYCFDAMNGMTFMASQVVQSTDFDWAVVYFPGDYGEDYLAGASIAGSVLGLPAPLVIPQATDDASIAATVQQLVAAEPRLVVFAVGPSQMATIAGGLATSLTPDKLPALMGAGPTWFVGLTQTPVMPYLAAAYFNTSPWGGWDTESAGHAAMRAVAEEKERDPSNGYVAGWAFSYTWLALLTEAIASGDLTRANVRAIADDLTDIDFQGMIGQSDGSYAGAPADFASRGTIISRASTETSDGLKEVANYFTSPVAIEYPFEDACYAG